LQGIIGKAVVYYREPFITQQMGGWSLPEGWRIYFKFTGFKTGWC